MTFFTVIGTGIREHGLVGFWTGLVPHMEVPRVIAVVLIPLLFVIEAVGLLTKHFVLSVRLLANMFAGHLVLAVFMGFIAVGRTIRIGGLVVGHGHDAVGGVGPKPIGVVLRIPSGIYIYISFGAVHWNGDSPALTHFLRRRNPLNLFFSCKEKFP